MIVQKILALMFLITGLAISNNVWSSQAGFVQFVNGNVTLTTAKGSTLTVHKGDPINEGDTITTSRAASAQVKMQDGGFIAVRPDTQLKFDSFKFSSNRGDAESSFFSLIKGGFRAITGLIGRDRKQDYHITTTTATIGIRGTDHETIMVLPGDPLVVAGLAVPGVYNKVNMGETSITTAVGSINVTQNQMGFAGGMSQMPVILPINADLFTVPPPASAGAKFNSSGNQAARTTLDMSTSVSQAPVQAQAISPIIMAVAPPTVVPVIQLQAAQQAFTGGFAPGVYSSSSGLSGIETAVAPNAPGTAVVNTELLPIALGGSLTFNSYGLIDDTPSGGYIRIGTASNVDVGGVANVIEWGRWSNGTIVAGGWYNGLTFGPNQGWSYLVGVQTPSLPVTGNYTFNLMGGTSPTVSDGVGGGLGLGHLISGATNVNFGSATVSGNLMMGFNGNSVYNMTYSGSPTAIGTTATTVSQSGINLCGTGCSTTVVGQFYGTNANYLGVGYMITTNSNFNINGVAAYKR